MANTKISELGAAGALDGSELVPVVQGGDTVRTTAAELVSSGLQKIWVDYTVGNLSLTSTSWADIPASGAMDLVFAAASGDTIQVGIGGYMTTPGNNWANFDVATIVSSAPVRYLSSGTTVQAGDGFPGWQTPGARGEGAVTGMGMFTLGAGDISGGQVTLRIRYKVSGGTWTVRSNTTQCPMHFFAVNLGQG